MQHWREQLLALLFLVGTLIPFLILPRSSAGILIQVELVPIGWALAFAVWVGVVWVACWFHDRRQRDDA